MLELKIIRKLIFQKRCHFKCDFRDQWTKIYGGMVGRRFSRFCILYSLPGMVMAKFKYRGLPRFRTSWLLPVTDNRQPAATLHSKILFVSSFCQKKTFNLYWMISIWKGWHLKTHYSLTSSLKLCKICWARLCFL